MISKRDVITMYVPFPGIDSTLAVNSHMYICMQDGNNKEFIKCQTFKPTHLIKDKPPYQFIVERPNSSRNPFKKTTTIDCDKSFCISNVTISRDLLAWRNICTELFDAISNKIKHSAFYQVVLDPKQLSNINPYIRHP